MSSRCFFTVTIHSSDTVASWRWLLEAKTTSRLLKWSGHCLMILSTLLGKGFTCRWPSCSKLVPTTQSLSLLISEKLLNKSLPRLTFKSWPRWVPFSALESWTLVEETWLFLWPQGLECPKSSQLLVCWSLLNLGIGSLVLTSSAWLWLQAASLVLILKISRSQQHLNWRATVRRHCSVTQPIL